MRQENTGWGKEQSLFLGEKQKQKETREREAMKTETLFNLHLALSILHFGVFLFFLIPALIAGAFLLPTNTLSTEKLNSFAFNQTVKSKLSIPSPVSVSYALVNFSKNTNTFVTSLLSSSLDSNADTALGGFLGGLFKGYEVTVSLSTETATETAKPAKTAKTKRTKKASKTETPETPKSPKSVGKKSKKTLIPSEIVSL